uniref:coiled-coil domain-containing protein 124-like n=1 Tax=Styela clava TaxID=7725 RepID=UPI0019399EA1|nr:coiled-coil domain-containing protein 124-like [Styela clava]
MPKKFRGENSKSSEARARKAAVANEAKTQKLKAVEDAYWADDNKSLQKKQQRKAEKEMKRTENLNRKKEKEELYNAEMDSLKSKKTEVKKNEKLTRAQIAANAEIERLEKERQINSQKKENDSEKVEGNVNRLVGDLVAQGEVIEARSVEDAISVLSVATELERHPERRMKAAYTKFEEENMPRLKKENPNLRLSQLKQMLKKDWQKCPDNPMNARFVSYNTKLS